MCDVLLLPLLKIIQENVSLQGDGLTALEAVARLRVTAENLPFGARKMPVPDPCVCAK